MAGIMRWSVCGVVFAVVLLVTLAPFSADSSEPTIGSHTAAQDGAVSPPRQAAAARHCAWRFVAYHPSPLEKEWWDQIETFKRDSCKYTMTRYKAALYDGVMTHASSFVPHAVTAEDQVPRASCSDRLTYPDLDALRRESDVYSWFEYRNDCTDETYRSPIEPLAGPLRHPRLCAPGWDHPDVVRRDWLVIDPWLAKQTDKRRFFDVGASRWSDERSQSWFWSIFARQCVPFNSIHAWEKKSMDAQDALRGIPTLIKPHYHWFNVPATTGVKDSDNPLVHLAAVAQPSDYVLMKLDIDHTPTEEALVDQLLANNTLLTLLDEFFWEHHVVFPSLKFAWGQDPGMKDQGATISILARMRRSGVRAHSWV